MSTPDYLTEGTSASDILAKMLSELPASLDKTEGGFLWDLLMPSALEKAELLQFYAPQIIQNMFPQTATGEWLDNHAAMAPSTITRRQATPAKGVITITGEADIVIRKGFLFSTEQINSQEAISYAADEDHQLDSNGTAEIPVTAINPGAAGNAAAHRVKLMSSPISGIGSIDNEEPMTGGTDTEGDEALRERILAVYRSEENVFTGAPRDYERWALQVPGVGDAIVSPLWDGPGTVKLVIVDEDGEPTDGTVVDDVHEHIMAELNPSARLAPIGVDLTVITPTKVSINIAATLKLREGATLLGVEQALRTTMAAYFRRAKTDGVVSVSKIGAYILNTDGVDDYTSVTVNGGAANITVTADEYPAIGTLTLSLYVGG